MVFFVVNIDVAKYSANKDNMNTLLALCYQKSNTRPYLSNVLH